MAVELRRTSPCAGRERKRRVQRTRGGDSNVSAESHPRDDASEDDRDPWERLAECEETLEMLVEEDVPFADRASTLLEKLEQEGYR